LGAAILLPVLYNLSPCLTSRSPSRYNIAAILYTSNRSALVIIFAAKGSKTTVSFTLRSSIHEIPSQDSLAPHHSVGTIVHHIRSHPYRLWHNHADAHTNSQASNPCPARMDSYDRILRLLHGPGSRLL